MSDRIDSSDDLEREMDDLRIGEMPNGHGSSVEPSLTAQSTSFPSWIKWMILGDLVIVAVVLLVFVL